MFKQHELEELVFAIPTEQLWKLLTYQESGLIHGNINSLNRIVQKGFFKKRSELEEDPSYKQVIPYAIISHKESILLFKRTSGQAEKRLHDKLHIGIGGHMNPGHSMEQDQLYVVDELKRELFEELNFSEDCSIQRIEFIGFINDDTIRVGLMHIGLFYMIQVSNKNIVVNETDKMTAEWLDKPDFSQVYNEMETWSRIAFDYFKK